MPESANLADLLRSVSDALFPADLGDAPVSVNSRGMDDDTPLHVLAWRDDTAGAAMLIAGGADVNAIGDMGETPLHVAVRRQNREMTRLLLTAGADENIRSEFGQTAREMAEPNLSDLFGS
jgi:uncharacterized protein